jgi:glycosyltransferase involved in cell wall biosynthesis
MHIVFANQWFPPESGWGGVAMHNHAMAHAYRTLGHEVTVIASRNSPEMPAEYQADGIRVQRILVKDAYRWRRVPGVGRYVRPVKQLTYAHRIGLALRVLHKQRRIDVIEFAEIGAEGFFYTRAPEAPVVVRCHTPSFVLREYFSSSELSDDTSIVSLLEKNVIRRALALTAPSRDMANRVAEATGVSREHICVVPNAVCVYDFDGDNVKGHGRDGSITVLYVGRLERAKGILVLAEAIPRVVKQAPTLRFLIAGYDRSTSRGTSQRTELEASLAKAGVTANVTFLGAVEQSQLPALYELADLCVVPSLQYESFSYTCAQAMAAGKPVVATRIGGIPETLDNGECGILVTPGSVEELADAIVRLACHAELRKQLGRAGHDKVTREFDPILVAQKNLEVYECAVKGFRCAK